MSNCEGIVKKTGFGTTRAEKILMPRFENRLEFASDRRTKNRLESRKIAAPLKPQVKAHKIRKNAKKRGNAALGVPRQKFGAEVSVDGRFGSFPQKGPRSKARRFWRFWQNLASELDSRGAAGYISARSPRECLSHTWRVVKKVVSSRGKDLDSGRARNGKRCTIAWTQNREG